MKNILKISNVYTFLWCVYYTQIATTTKGSWLGRLSLLGALAISFYYFCLCMTTIKLPRYFKALNLLFFMLSAYGTYRLIPGTEVKYGLITIARFDYLKNILMSIIPIYVYYYFSLKGYINKKWLMRWSIIFIAVALYSFYGYQIKRYYVNTTISNISDFDFTNNTSYLFVNILPLLVFFRKRPYLQYFLLFFLSAYVFLGLKRGAIIILAICLLFYFLKSNSQTSSRTNFKRIILIGIFLVVGFYGLSYFYSQNVYFQQRTENTLQGESSSRNVLYSQLFSYYNNQTDIVNLVFGNGANATIGIIGKNAHNDWLEILINQGLFGFCVFLYYWYVFFLICKKAYKRGKPDEIGLALIMVFIICFLKTFFSMSINDMNVFITSVLGFCLYGLEFSNNNIVNV